MKRKVALAAIALIFLTGLWLFSYPYLSRWKAEYRSEQTVEYLDELIRENGDKKPFEKLYNKLQDYNRQIFEEGQRELKDPLSYEIPPFDLTDYGFEQNVIGILWIPRLDLELPVYLGANADTMANGAGLLGQTSLPVNGNNSNIVLAGHRGWRGTPMFRDIQSIQSGDKIQITTPWETLIYRVSELKIVPKEESRVLYIQEGREMVTLLTCHPYTKNEQRYIVIADRSKEKSVSKEEDRKEVLNNQTEDFQDVEVLTDKGYETEKVSSKANTPVLSEGMEEYGAVYSNRQIWWEQWGPVIGIMVVVLLAGILWSK